MKTKNELNADILKTTADIQEKNPELLKFVDEMTVTIPSEVSPEITEATLKEYNDSLQNMATEYNKHSKKHLICPKRFLK